MGLSACFNMSDTFFNYLQGTNAAPAS